jgi:hypothetical protein
MPCALSHRHGAGFLSDKACTMGLSVRSDHRDLMTDAPYLHSQGCSFSERLKGDNLGLRAGVM